VVNAERLSTLPIVGVDVRGCSNMGDEVMVGVELTSEPGVEGFAATSGATEERRLSLCLRRPNQRYKMNAVNARLTSAREEVMPATAVFDKPLSGGVGGGSAAGDAVCVTATPVGILDAEGKDVEGDIFAGVAVGFAAANAAVMRCLSEACQLICMRGA
jgi:hypothetical protein